jgi:hypothetical protein
VPIKDKEVRYMKDDILVILVFGGVLFVIAYDLFTFAGV